MSFLLPIVARDVYHRIESLINRYCKITFAPAIKVAILQLIIGLLLSSLQDPL